VALSVERRERLLREAQELYGAREYTALVNALSPLERGDLLEVPDLGFLLADAWHRLGNREGALHLLEALGPVCARRGNDRLFRDRLNLEGALLFGLGRIDEAEDAWGRLRSAAASAGDANFAARSSNNLGVIYTMRGEREEALASYARAIAAYQQLGYLRGLAQAHQNQAITYRELDFWRDADHHFLRAIDYAAQDGSQDEVARARQERALLLCYTGDRHLARQTARQALRSWERLSDPAGLGDTHRVLGLIALATGGLDEAEEEAEQALVFAQRAHAPLLEAETRELLAAVASGRGDEARGASLRSGAEELFASLGAGSWGAQLRLRVGWLAGGR